MTRLAALSLDDYGFAGFDSLESPCLIVYEKLVRENIARIEAELEAIVPQSGLRHLRPHVKTHKSAWATRLQLEAGVERFKSTPHEFEMLLEAGARDIFVAYPPLPSLAAKLADAQSRFAETRLSSQVATIEHAEALSAAAERHDVRLDAFLDLDVGAARTGIDPRDVVGLAKTIAGRDLRGLHIVGVHAYDGHNHSADVEERRALARDAMARVVEAYRELAEICPDLDRLCVGGSPGALPCFETLVRDHVAVSDGGGAGGIVPGRPIDLDVSPGTFVYWDSKYDGLMPDRFRIAALVYARVMDRPGRDRITLDLGHKRWAIDQGPVELFSEPGLEVIGTTEEHTVLRCDDSSKYAIGTPILIAPKHVCPTVNLWEEFRVVRPDGTLDETLRTVTARNR